MICFIVNPAAGSGKAEAAVPIIEQLMRDTATGYSLVYTYCPGDFERVAAQVDLIKPATIACVGGDGTVQEYVGLAVGRDVNFSVIPAGSANDLLYSVPGGIHKFRTFDDKITSYVKKILDGKTIPVDLVSVNGERFFFNIGGTGIDIQVLRDAHPLKKRFGGASYFLSLIKNVFTYRAQEITLTVDGNAQTEKFTLLAVCNGGYYGGKLRIAPGALIDDGLITLCKVKNISRIKLMAMFPLVKPGWHGCMKEVSLQHCKEVTLMYSGKKTINFDGNLYEYAAPLTFKIVNAAVRLII